MDDQDTIEYLKVVKDSKELNTDLLEELTDEQRKGIERGLQDIDAGRLTSHEDIKFNSRQEPRKIQ